ncbi:hypothetical protein [Acaryochloris sp. IP29b_bin.148]|uniref:hypothetical protein n=1 Tax=Acaryochloris sp. IP29b_bin.148 TaxID=2969218 RepID=UPI0026238D53|nr:hypothetical protein [Acaryochloris sp. IP29b_bin.148]
MNQEKTEYPQINQSGSAGSNLSQAARDQTITTDSSQRGSNNQILIPIMIVIFGGAAGALYLAKSQTNGGPTQEYAPVERSSQ